MMLDVANQFCSIGFLVKEFYSLEKVFHITIFGRLPTVRYRLEKADTHYRKVLNIGHNNQPYLMIGQPLVTMPLVPLPCPEWIAYV